MLTARRFPTSTVLLALATVLYGCTGGDVFTNAEADLGPVELAWSHELTDDHVDNTQPVIDGGRAFVVAGDDLHAFDLETGKRIWETGLGSTTLSMKLLHEGDRLYLQDARLVRAYSKDDSRVVWETRIDDFRSQGRIMAQNETHLFWGGRRSEVARIRKVDGVVDLRIPVNQLEPDGAEQRASNPVVSTDGIVYIPAGFYREDFGAIEGNLLAYDAQTGEYLWGYDIPNRKVKLPGRQDSTYLDAGTYDADISDDLVVFPAGQTIYALDRFTGEKRWETFFEEDAFDIGISVGKGMVYVGSLQQHVYALDLQTGEVLWQTYSPGSITTILTVKDGRVYFCNEAGGQLWVLDAKTGKVIWNGFPPEYEEDRDYYYLSPLAVGEGYMVNVGSRKMYGLTVP